MTTPDEVAKAVENAYLLEAVKNGGAMPYYGRKAVWFHLDAGDMLETDLGLVTFVEYISHGDDECTGRTEMIFELRGEHYSKQGMYYSHSGMEWDGGVYKVKKQTRTVTVTEWGTVR